MKKKFIPTIVSILILLLFFSTSCSQEIETEHKNYFIKVYIVDWEVVNLTLSGLPDLHDITKTVLENEVITRNTKIDYFQAIEIISYTENSIRFVDRNGKEHFITADYIEVEQR